MQDDKISLKMGYEDGREESDTLEITEIETAEGQNGYSIYFNTYKDNDEVCVYRVSDTLVYDPYEDEEYYPREEVFKFSIIPNLYPDWAEPLELTRSTWDVGAEKLTRIIISGQVRIYNGKEPTDEKSFAVYRGGDGYALLVLPNARYRIIDGKKEHLIFDANDNTTGFVEKTGFPSGANGGIISNLRASSYLTDASHTYSADGMLGVYLPQSDSNWWLKNNIPWAEGKDDDGIGETIDFDVSTTSDHRMVAVSLTILNGYVDPLRPNLFYENNRVKTMLVTTNEGEEVTVNFNDVVEFTTIELPVTTTHVTLTIQEVYKGSKYSDTCITALDARHQIWDK